MDRRGVSLIWNHSLGYAPYEVPFDSIILLMRWQQFPSLDTVNTAGDVKSQNSLVLGNSLPCLFFDVTAVDRIQVS